MPDPDVHPSHQVVTVNGLECVVVASEATVVILTPPGKAIHTGLVFSPEEATKLGNALLTVGHIGSDNEPDDD